MGGQVPPLPMPAGAHVHRRYKIPRGTPSEGGGVKYKGWEIFANIALYLGKGTR